MKFKPRKLMANLGKTNGISHISPSSKRLQDSCVRPFNFSNVIIPPSNSKSSELKSNVNYCPGWPPCNPWPWADIPYPTAADQNVDTSKSSKVIIVRSTRLQKGGWWKKGWKMRKTFIKPSFGQLGEGEKGSIEEAQTNVHTATVSVSKRP